MSSKKIFNVMVLGFMLYAICINTVNAKRKKAKQNKYLAKIYADMKKCNKSFEPAYISIMKDAKGNPVFFVSSYNVSDLNVFKGLKLKQLMIGETQSGDLNALKGMPLTLLSIKACPNLTNISAIKYLKNLKQFNLQKNPNLKNLKDCKGSIIEELNFTDCKNLTDISAVKNLKSLKYLYLSNTGVKSLTPLKNHPTLKRIVISKTDIKDFSVLKTVKLNNIAIDSPNLKDLSIFNGPALHNLQIGDCPNIKTLEPLKSFTEIKYLTLPDQIEDLSPIKNLKFETLKYKGRNYNQTQFQQAFFK